MNIEIIPNEQTPKTLPFLGDIDTFLNKNHEVLDAFLAFAETCSTAVGLAANQVSIDGDRFMERVFALRDLKTSQWQLIINPIITEYVGMVETKAEGCLTWKGQIVVARRNRGVKVSYYTTTGTFVENELHKGFEAQIWQHEINHLNGVEEMIIDPNKTASNFNIVSGEPERNVICPCGSGKKYKNCCLLLK